MENQPPRLPWYRLATMARQESPPPSPTAPTRQPALPLVRPPVVPIPRGTPSLAPQPTPTPRGTPSLAPQPTPTPRVTPSLAPQPTPQPMARPESPAIQQETQKQVVETNNGSTRPTPSPPPSPKVIKSSSSPTPPPSPKVVAQIPNNNSTNPEPEMRQLDRLKSIAMQDFGNNQEFGSNYNNNNSTGNGNYENGKNHNNNSNYSSDSVNMRENAPFSKENARKSESRVHYSPTNHRKNEKDMKVITVAGENVGALMELGQSQGYNRKFPHGIGKTLTNESKSQEEKAKDNTNKANGAAKTKPMTSLVNSNVQSINNSLIFGSSCTERNPGVHLTFKMNGRGKGKKFQS